MNRALLFIVVFSVLAQAFRHAGIVASFHWNREYIAKNLCEKRDEPESTCKGQCFLKKKLKKAAEKENKMPAPQKEQEIVWFFTLSPTLPLFEGRFLFWPEACWSVAILQPQSWKNAVFRPPLRLV